MKIVPVAKAHESSLQWLNNTRKLQKEIIPVLTSIEPPPRPNLDTAFSIQIILGEGTNARALDLKLQPMLSVDVELTAPHFLDLEKRFLLVYPFLLAIDPPPMSPLDIERALLLAEKHVLAESVSIEKLRAEVAAMKAIQDRNIKQRRSPIPDAIRQQVWVRDQGCCVHCGANSNLQFDHIIPYSKGGADSEQNLQILCERCNRIKSDTI